MTDYIPDTPTTRWWGAHQLHLNSTLTLQIGPLALALQSQASEWILEWSRDIKSPRAASSAGQRARFIFEKNQRQVFIVPRLPDRSMTTKFQVPLRILPGDTARIYIVVPLWVALQNEKRVELVELPTWRLSDTWIGQNSTAGEIGYAGRVPAYTSLDQIPRRWDLAISPVLIRNQSSSIFTIDRFNLPAPHLTLYYSEAAGFWTETITIEHSNHSELADAKFDSRAPKEAERAQIVTAPREQVHETHRVVRAFSALFKQ